MTPSPSDLDDAALAGLLIRAWKEDQERIVDLAREAGMPEGDARLAGRMLALSRRVYLEEGLTAAVVEDMRRLAMAMPGSGVTAEELVAMHTQAGGHALRSLLPEMPDLARGAGWQPETAYEPDMPWAAFVRRGVIGLSEERRIEMVRRFSAILPVVRAAHEASMARGLAPLVETVKDVLSARGVSDAGLSEIGAMLDHPEASRAIDLVLLPLAEGQVRAREARRAEVKAAHGLDPV